MRIPFLAENNEIADQMVQDRIFLICRFFLHMRKQRHRSAGSDCAADQRLCFRNTVLVGNPEDRFSLICRFLAHLSQRLIGEFIGYQWSGVRPSASVVRRPSVVNNFKRLLLRNRWSDQSQILCGASLGRANDILFAASGSHDQDGRHAHIW